MDSRVETQDKQPAKSGCATQPYSILVDDMTCASCVARVEKAIRKVAGVTDASVNLVEHNALVSGGEPAQVIDAISEQGYPARLVETKRGKNSFVIVVDAADGDARSPGPEAVLWQSDDLSALRGDGRRLEITTSEHPADLLIRLRQVGHRGPIEEQFADRYQ